MVDNPLASGGFFGVNTHEGKTTAYRNDKRVQSYINATDTSPRVRISRNFASTSFASGRLKVERAKRHISDLEAAVQFFNESNPYEYIEVVDNETDEYLVRVRVSKPIPIEFSGILGDAVHNLRAALDGLICDLIRIETGRDDVWDRGFPIKEQAKRLKLGTVKQIQGVSAKTERLILRLKACPGWNNPMWKLHWLDIVDKHNRVVAVAAATIQVTAKVGVPGMFLGPDGNIRLLGPGPGGVPYMVDAGTPSTFKRVTLSDEFVEVHRSPAGFNEEVKMTFGLAFAQNMATQGEPVLKTLNHLCDLVERTLWAFERHTI